MARDVYVWSICRNFRRLRLQNSSIGEYPTQQWLIWMSTWLVKFSINFELIPLISRIILILALPVGLPEAACYGSDAWTLWKNHGKRVCTAAVIYGWVRRHMSSFTACCCVLAICCSTECADYLIKIIFNPWNIIFCVFTITVLFSYGPRWP